MLILLILLIVKVLYVYFLIFKSEAENRNLATYWM